MASYYEILGISSNSTMEQIEAAFQKKSEYWRRLQANPQRSGEATAMLEQVMVAYETLRAQHQSAAGGLEFREPRVFSGQAGTAPADKDSCPHCGHKGNPPDARFCLGCGDKLFQVCPNPSCQAELPWHYERCHHCGVSILEANQEQERQQRLREIELFRQQEERLNHINQQLAILMRVQSRLQSFSSLFVLRRSEAGKWIKENPIGCGHQLIATVIWIISAAIALTVGGIIGNRVELLGILIIGGGIFGTPFLISFYYLGPIHLAMIADQRMRLEGQKRQLQQDMR